MMKNASQTIDELEKRLNNLEEKCINGKEHELEPFVYYGERSDFEKICKKCKGYFVDKKELYLYAGLIMYFESERYKSLVKESELLKNEMG